MIRKCNLFENSNFATDRKKAVVEHKQKSFCPMRLSSEKEEIIENKPREKSETEKVKSQR